MRPRRGAFLGFGHVAEHGHLPAWRERRDVELVAVADTDAGRRSRAAQLMPEARVYVDAAELLGAEDIDFVDITTPPAMHAALIAAAARHGRHVLCEKPLATRADHYRVAAEAVRDADVTLFTVHNWKHSTPFLRVSSLLAGGVLGRLHEIRIESLRSQPSVTVGNAWRNRAAIAGGGILVDHGWHALYLLLALAAENPLRVRAVLEKRRYTEADVEDTATCSIEFPSVRGEIFLTWAASERLTRWRVAGELGWLELEEQHLRLHRDGATEIELLPQSLSAGSHHPEWFGPVIEGFLQEVGGGAGRGINLAEAASCLTLLTLAYESAAREGEALPVPPGLAAAGCVAA